MHVHVCLCDIPDISSLATNNKLTLSALTEAWLRSTRENINYNFSRDKNNKSNLYIIERCIAQFVLIC